MMKKNKGSPSPRTRQSPKTLKNKESPSPRTRQSPKASPSPGTTQSPKAVKYSLCSTSPLSQQHSHKQWQEIIKKIAPAVLAMKMTYARAFEDATPYEASGTAFVVDKKRGVALTNQHNATDGPATFTLRFISGEHVPAYRIYTNPVYDFAFVKFDPSLIEYMEVAEIELDPDGAQPGAEILITGNDSSERFLICPGIINRLEFLQLKDAEYSAFYNKANVVTEPGASGSPVVDINGKAVGISANSGNGNAGLVPLDKVVRVLENLMNGFDDSGNWLGIDIPTKTLGAAFILTTLEEIKDNCFTTEEDCLSIAKRYGQNFFGVRSIHTESQLRENDLILQINNDRLQYLVEDGLDVEDMLEDVDEDFVYVTVARHYASSGCLRSVLLKVDVFDMEEMKPDQILEMSGSSIYSASHRSALHNEIDVDSLVVAEPGGCFESYMKSTSLLTSVNGKNITSFNKFLKELERSVTSGKNLELHVENDSEETIKTTGRDFYQWLSLPFIWDLDDTFKWTRETLQLKRPGDINHGIVPLLGPGQNLQNSSISLTSSYPPNHKPEDTFLVGVSYKLYDYIDNINNVSSFYPRSGTGIVIYQSSEIGIVLTPRPNAPLLVGKVDLYFRPSLTIYGTAFFVDTNRGFSLIYYDPRNLSNYADKIKPAQLSSKPPAINDMVRLVCHDRERKESVSVYGRLNRVNKEFYFNSVDTDIRCDDIAIKSGLVVDNDSKVKGEFRNILSNNLEAMQIYSLPSILKPLELVMKSLLKDPSSLCYGVRLPVFQAKLLSVPVEDAIKLGLSYKWVNGVLNKPNSQRRFLMLKYCLPESNAAKSVKLEDLILSINGQHVCSMEDLDEHLFGESDLNIKVLRDCMEQDVWVEREFISKPPKIRVVFWCGLLVQDTLRELNFNEGFTPNLGVVINNSYSFCRGRPSELYDGCCWVSAVNGMEVRNLEEFVEVTRKFEDGEDVLCKLMTWDGKTIAFNYTVDYLHLPTIELTFDEVNQLWHQEEISPKWKE